ncbi:DUF2185 domain-containing protein [Microbacterium sp. Leaf203]|jgi:hypothetical protein|uniref:DUF2185 domain-containing protein n=1 Tax=Microbacterium sp. Leaf203 TaxID=1735677 RepID=UPI0006FE5C5D|nr:DUF2185 domain-containing protein [Microbacterium sp. Leaf203]KQM40436.1 hypothetical protein ASE56_08880 [Microbacterium sp. Leaf203]
MSANVPEFVRDSGASIASRRVLDGSAPLKWAVREAPSNPSDNGWRFFSEIDDESYLGDPSNLEVASFNTIAAIEPAVIPLLNMPVGTDLAIIRDRGAIRFFDNETGREVPASDLG